MGFIIKNITNNNINLELKDDVFILLKPFQSFIFEGNVIPLKLKKLEINNIVNINYISNKTLNNIKDGFYNNNKIDTNSTIHEQVVNNIADNIPVNEDNKLVGEEQYIGDEIQTESTNNIEEEIKPKRKKRNIIAEI